MTLLDSSYGDEHLETFYQIRMFFATEFYFIYLYVPIEIFNFPLYFLKYP